MSSSSQQLSSDMSNLILKFQSINIGQPYTNDDFSNAPTAAMASNVQTFQLPPLYRLGAYNKSLVWMISFDGQYLVIQWGPVEDMKNGSLQISRTAVKTNKSGRNLYEQALSEARSRWKRKQDKDGYSETVIDTAIMNMEAMLCNKWDPHKNQIKRWPVWVEEKLDGVRGRANEDVDGSVILVSRTTQIISFLQHIKKDLSILFKHIKNILNTYYPKMAPIFRTDGELYSTELTFDQVSGICRLTDKSGPNPNEIYIKYYLFDLVVTDKLTYDERYAILQTAYNAYDAENPKSNIKLIIPLIANSKQDILTAHNQYVSQGFEGVIIRKIGGVTAKEREESYYLGRRCSNILKYKEFQDAEGIVIGAEQGKGSEEGAVVWLIRDVNGHEFTVRPRGDIETRKLYYQHYHKFIGQKYRYRFQDLTPDGNPRFPVGIGFVYDR